MPEWFEDDEFWSTWYPHVFNEERFDQAVTEVDQLLVLSGFEVGTVLDLACGPGRHAIEFAKRGCQVTGVDRSPFLLSKAVGRAKTAKVDVEWVEQDMRIFERPETFDLAINMFTAFGYFEDKSEDLQVLERLHNSLVSGGILVIDVISKEWLAGHFEAASSSEAEDGSLLITRREIIDDWTRIRSEWILLKGDEAMSFDALINIYSGQELRDRLESVGFEDVELFGDLDGNEYGLNVKRLIAVARK